jgi:hypothetical protein
MTLRSRLDRLERLEGRLPGDPALTSDRAWYDAALASPEACDLVCRLLEVGDGPEAPALTRRLEQAVAASIRQAGARKGEAAAGLTGAPPVLG